MKRSGNTAKTVILRSPDSDKVREVIVTSVLLPKSDNENNKTSLVKSFQSGDNLGVIMERRPSKRRLDHLTLEQKILRKKLKNREAAQTSRDKKKARLEELEASILRLQNENETLYEEVHSLKEEKETLKRENARLNEEVGVEAECCRRDWTCRVMPSAEGIVPALSTSPPTSYSAPVSPVSTNAALCFDDCDWDWLEQVPITPVVEELEHLANSLFAEAQDSQMAETQKESLVGTKTKSLESCRQSFANVTDEFLKPTNTKDSVIHSVKENFESSVPMKLDLKAAQIFNKESLKASELLLEMSSTSTLSNEGKKSCTNKITFENVISTTEKLLPPVKNEMSMEEEENAFLGGGMNCVVKEEIVETSEYLKDSDSVVPSIVLTETVEFIKEDEDIVDISSNFLAPGDLMECSSDQGYESYDSPISEPDQLINLFPELW